MIEEIVDKFHFSEGGVCRLFSFMGLYNGDFGISHFCPKPFVFYPGVCYVKEQNRNMNLKQIKILDKINLHFMKAFLVRNF